MDEGVPQGSTRGLWLYFAIVALLSIPFWLLSAASGLRLLPGLPVAAIMVVCPAAAAIALTASQGGGPAVRGLFGRLVDVQDMRGRAWLIPLLPFAVAGLAFLIMRAGGLDLPAPSASPGQVLVMLALFLPGAVAEELGWTGYALEPLIARFGPVRAALILGLIWAAWHYPALLQADRAPVWIAWWTLGTVAMRFVIVLGYVNAELGLAGAVLFHAASNLAWQLFPVQGSFFDPRLHGLIMAASALGLAAAWRGRLRA